jgi:nucleoside-diphosphate-sugar epimerase
VQADLARPDAVAVDGVTHVAHFAVATAGDRRAVNVEGTLALARATHTSDLERFLYIGSAWSRAPSGEPLFPYLADKLVAEQMLARVTGLPLVIARPSLAMGHTKLGCEPSASLFWVLRLIDRVGRLPWHRHQRLDVVPIDWLAANIARLLFEDAPAKAAPIHLSAGPRSLSWGQIEAAFGCSWLAEPMELDVWCDLASEVLGASPTVRGALERCLRFLSGDAVFHGAEPPPPSLSTYLSICLQRDGGRGIAEQALDDV